MMNNSIFWFRQDLRLEDNPALVEACRSGEILPIYIVDNFFSLQSEIGPANKIYLHHSLMSLNKSLNGNLNVYIGDSKEIIFDLIKKYNINNIFWNRCYEPWRIKQDQIITKALTDCKINHFVFNGSYLWEPESISKEDGSYYKVFSAYKRKVLLSEPRKPISKPENIILIKDDSNKTTINDLELTNDKIWEDKIKKHWDFGETAAIKKLENFLHKSLAGYKIGRDYPSYGQTSKLSVNLHFGEISPNKIWESVKSIGSLNASEDDVEHFLSEMIWREFSCYLMTNFDQLPDHNFQNKFDNFPWFYNETLFHKWKTGNTGYPIVDAGMRELWQTGYMHNRLRMIVASFLVKNLMIHWHHGRDWFWNCLVDADLANNSASWQWVAGSGADAAPYFRIFNPVIQGEKFDKDGEYTKKFVPELKNLPSEYLFKPWEAPERILQDADVVLGVNYPRPIVDLIDSRNKALDAYHALS